MPVEVGDQIFDFNIIDTPGHVDFTVEVNRSLRVLDGLVFLFSAVDGVEPQSETNWRLADNYKVPRIAFINKMDRAGSDFFMMCQRHESQTGFERNSIAGANRCEHNFKGVVDLVMAKPSFGMNTTTGMTYTEIPVPEDLVETVQNTPETHRRSCRLRRQRCSKNSSTTRKASP
jgi:elongation factor G